MATTDAGEAVEYGKCLLDCAYFLDTYGVIDDAQSHGGGGGKMPFKLWPAQVQVVWDLMITPLTIILKARQLGISWLCCGYALWLCLFRPGKFVLLFSQGQLEADEMLRRISVLYARLPEWLRDVCPLAKEPNTSSMEWANGSRIKSLPASKNAGSGFTASLVIMDEAAKIQFAGELYTALKPTIDGGGQLIILSTAYGIGNLFHLLWTKSVAGLNTFRTVFLPWRARPSRDQAFYDAKVAEETTPGKVKQEYPATATEAFLVSGRVRFNSDWVARQDANVREGLPVSEWPESLRDVQGLTIYSLPKKGQATAIGADVSEGLEHGDNSSAVLVDAATWEELADLHGLWEPDEYGRLLHLLSEAYGSTVVVERNNHGHATLAALKSLGCGRVAEGPDGRRGWHTNVQTKPQTIDRVAAALRDGLMTVRTQATLGELLIYRTNDNGTTSAPPGYFDDRVMKWAILLGWLNLPGEGTISGPPVDLKPVRRDYTDPRQSSSLLGRRDREADPRERRR